VAAQRRAPDEYQDGGGEQGAEQGGAGRPDLVEDRPRQRRPELQRRDGDHDERNAARV
jgi:hypothetical protein